jgi:hypothetical protein
MEVRTVKRNHRFGFVTGLLLGACLVAGIAFAPRAAVSTPPKGTRNVATAPAVQSADVARGELASRVNETLGLLASAVVTLDIPDTPGVLLTIDVPIGDELVTLDLVPHSIRAADYRVLAQTDDGSYAEVEPQPVRTLRGTVLGFEGSVVAASLLEDGLYARIIFDEQDEYWVEPIGSRIAGAAPDDYVVYRAADVIPNGASCGADALLQPPAEDEGGIGLRDACGDGVLCVAELACDADFQYFTDYGSVGAVENRIHNVINTMNVQYERDVEITHVITTIIVRTSSGANPYTTNNPSALLDQFRNYWQSNHGNIQRDLAELFTGRNLDGSVIGIAWLDAVCTSFGYSVVQSDCCGSLACATDLSAHEMGHNWGADHCTCPTYTMNAGLTCSNRFSPTATIPEIVSFRNGRQFCLDADLGCNAPIFIVQPESNETICPGDTVALHVEVDLADSAYQWRIGQTELADDGHFAGANTNTLTIFGFAPADEASNYNCVVTNVAENCSNVSNNATLALDNQAPVITSQPQDQNVNEGDPVAFNLGIGNPVFFTFQWRKDGNDLSDDGRITGTATSSLVILPVEPADQGAYDCVVTALLGGLCSTTSDAATLTVNPAADCPGDLDGDRDIDLADLSQLLGSYGTTSGATPEDGDLDGDGDVDLSDLSLLLGVYGTTCP